MNAWHAFHLLRPWWLLALLLLPVLPWILRRVGESASLRRLVDVSLLPYLVEGSERAEVGRVVGVMAGWTLACLAMAGPTWQRAPQPVVSSRSAQVIVVSMSQRMLAQDLAPDRLSRVRYKIHALLQANKAGQNALVAYAGAAFTVAPLTTDIQALTELVDALAPDTMPVPGDDAAAGIRRAVGLLKGAGINDGSIVLIDDHADAAALAAARAARATGMRVSVLGVGTDKGAPVPDRGGGFVKSGGHTTMARRDATSLKAVATAGGGRYVGITPGREDVQALATQLRREPGVRDTHHRVTTWQDRGAWLLLPLLVLMAFGFRRGALWLLCIALLPLWPTTVHAAGSKWQDAWHTRDQQAARALAEGHAEKAEKLAQDPALRGTAAYRAGHYDAAARAFARAPGARNQYNRGNALAMMHRYHDALKAYDRALADDPHLRQARSNRKAVLDWLRRAKPPKPPRNDHGAQGAGHDTPRDPSAGKGSPTPGKGAKSSAKDGTSRNARDRKASPSPASSAGRPAGNDQRHDERAKGDGTQQTPAAASSSGAGDAAARERAKAGLKRQLRQGGDKGEPRSYALGRAAPDTHDKGKPLPKRMREALERVPDDPGGLLRNKFMLEYQRRLQRGEAPPPDGGQ